MHVSLPELVYIYTAGSFAVDMIKIVILSGCFEIKPRKSFKEHIFFASIDTW